MNALFENFNFINSSNSSDTHIKSHSKDFFSNLTQINNPNLKEINTKEIYTCLNNQGNKESDRYQCKKFYKRKKYGKYS